MADDVRFTRSMRTENGRDVLMFAIMEDELRWGAGCALTA